MPRPSRPRRRNRPTTSRQPDDDPAVADRRGRADADRGDRPNCRGDRRARPPMPPATPPTARCRSPDIFQQASASRKKSSIPSTSSTPARCWASPWPAIATADGQRTLSAAARRRRDLDRAHRRQAAQGVERHVHGRRFLRKQDERIRQRVRLRAARPSCKQMRGMTARRPASPASRRFRSGCGRAPTATKSAASCGRPFRRNFTACKPGATSKGRCWPPCRWKPRSSTCCCS